MIRRQQLSNKVSGTALSEQSSAGVLLHMTSLPGDYGVGELGGAAFAFVDRMKTMGLSVWQFLPLGPTAYGDSPYQPLSSFAGNEMLIDIAELIRLQLISSDEAAPLTRLSRDQVDYGKLIPIKRKLLSLAASRFDARATAQLKTAFDEFRHKHDKWLHDYALFRVLKTRHDEVAWPQWPEPLAKRDRAALRRVEQQSGAELKATKLAQFLFDDQLRRLKHYANDNGIRLFGDIPIYVALDSADVWAHREIVLIDGNARPNVVAGVPPDYYSKDGQLWGNPVYDWSYHQRDGYQWWIDRLQQAMAATDLVRIDHFRGFEAYWAVPACEKTARNGTWMPGPGFALFDAMRQALGELPIIAENLGVITPPVEALRNEYAMPGMIILQFDASKEDFNIDDIEANCVCYTGGHDNDTTLGWFNGGPGDIRSKDEIRKEQRVILAKIDGKPETIHLDLIRYAFASKARLAIVPMQDFLGLGSESRLNTPGTQHNNWRWRLLDEQLTNPLCDSIAAMVDAGGRRH